MKMSLPTEIEVNISDNHLLEMINFKHKELLDGADYAEQDEGTDTYWLWKSSDSTGIGKPNHEKVREISKEEYHLLDSLQLTMYGFKKYLDSK